MRISGLMLDRIHHIPDNGRGCCEFSGTLSVEHDIAYRITGNHNGIKDIVRTGKRMALRNKMRRHIGKSAVLAVFKNSEKLDRGIHFLRIFHILCGDCRDTDSKELGRIDIRTVKSNRT